MKYNNHQPINVTEEWRLISGPCPTRPVAPSASLPSSTACPYSKSCSRCGAPTRPPPPRQHLSTGKLIDQLFQWEKPEKCNLLKGAPFIASIIPSLLCLQNLYWVIHLLLDLGWVDFDLKVVPWIHRLPRQDVGTPKSKSTQSRSRSRWITLYTYCEICVLKFRVFPLLTHGSH